jgi:hypothetical protein
MELSVCPECGEPAEIQWRAVLESTGGPVEHAKVLCVRRHWFLLPTAKLASRPSTTAKINQPGERTQ